MGTDWVQSGNSLGCPYMSFSDEYMRIQGFWRAIRTFQTDPEWNLVKNLGNSLFWSVKRELDPEKIMCVTRGKRAPGSPPGRDFLTPRPLHCIVNRIIRRIVLVCIADCINSNRCPTGHWNAKTKELHKELCRQYGLSAMRAMHSRLYWSMYQNN